MSSEAAKGYWSGATIGQIGQGISHSYSAHKTAVVAMAIVFITSLVNFITAAVCASKITKIKSEYATDVEAHSAHTNATWSAVISALLFAGSLAALGILLTSHKPTH